MLQPPADLLDHVGAGLLVDEGVDAGFQRICARHQLANRVLAPHQPALLGEIELGIGRVVETIGAEMEFGGKRHQRRLAQGLGFIGAG